MVLGQQRLGVNLLSLIATLREEGRLPIRSVQWYLDTVHQLRLSVGAIVSAIHQTRVDSGRGQDRTLRGKAPVECAIDDWS